MTLSTTPHIAVGQQWKDNDPRSPDRIVEVVELSERCVYYTYKNRRSVSARMRFIKAFTLVK